MCYTKVIHNRGCGHFFYDPRKCDCYPGRCLQWDRRGYDLDGECYACIVERDISPQGETSVIKRKAEERLTDDMSFIAEEIFAEELRRDPSCRASLKRRIPRLQALSRLQSNTGALENEWEVIWLIRLSEITTRLENRFFSGERFRRRSTNLQNHHIHAAFTILEAMEIMIFHPRHPAVSIIFLPQLQSTNDPSLSLIRNMAIPVDLGSLPENERECSICKEQYGFTSNDGQITAEFPVMLARCSHVFGRHCLRLWLKDHRSCPYCRRDPFEGTD